MTIDWSHFTPYASLAGGVVLGLAASLLMLVHGRVLGVSGIVAGLFFAKPGDRAWRAAFLLGMFAAPASYLRLAPPEWISAPRIDASVLVVIVAGLLVGYRTRLGSGCTSGHGVCGLSRLSPRSLVATLSFMASGFVAVYLVRHVLGLDPLAGITAPAVAPR